MIELRVLGTLDLRDKPDGRPIAAVLAQPKRMALLTHLALASRRGGQRRDTLLLLFWPNSSEERARNSLNQAVFNLRRSLGEGAIAGVGEELRTDAGLVWCDAVAFEEALDAGDTQQALSLYAGDLLAGFNLDDCGEFERWLDGERERLRSRALAAALSIAAEAEEGGNGLAAAELLRRAVTWAPYDEATVVRLVRLLARSGDRPGALREYERFRKLLASDLDISPSKELEALAREIREENAQHSTHGKQGVAGAPHTAADVAAPQAAPAIQSRTQRRPERRWLAAAVALVLLVVSGAGLLAANRGRSASPIEPVQLDFRRVLIAAFENHTGETDLDPLSYMAADWIAQGLARTGLARVVPFSTVVQETPHLRAEGAAPEVAVQTANRQFAQRVGAGILITGAYYRIGDSLALQAHVIDVATGELIRGIDEVRGPVMRPAAAVEELQRRSLGTLALLYDERLESWPDPAGQPSNIEAYRLFSDGMSAFMRAMGTERRPEQRQSFSRAAQKFVAAAAADTAFVMPLLWAGYAYSNLYDADSVRAILAALERRPLSRWSRTVMDHQLAHLAGDREAEYQAARELADLSPDSEWLMKLARSAMETGRHREALDVLLRLDPDRGWLRGWNGYWRLRVEVQHVLGNHAAALEGARRGLAARPDDTWLQTQELWALAALGRVDDVIARLGPPVAAGDPFALWRLNSVVQELGGHGRAREKRRLLREMIPLAQNGRAAEATPRAQFHLAQMLELAGSDGEAAAVYTRLLQERPDVAEFRVRAALLAARRGDPGPAGEALRWLSALSDEALERTFPAPELALWGTRRAWLAVNQARLLAQLDQAERAVETLQSAIDAGLNHVYMNLHDDPDFEPLRRHPGFQRLLRSRG